MPFMEIYLNYFALGSILYIKQKMNEYSVISVHNSSVVSLLHLLFLVHQLCIFTSDLLIDLIQDSNVFLIDLVKVLLC